MGKVPPRPPRARPKPKSRHDTLTHMQPGMMIRNFNPQRPNPGLITFVQRSLQIMRVGRNVDAYTSRPMPEEPNVQSLIDQEVQRINRERGE